MKDFSGISPSSLPDAADPMFVPRLRSMVSAVDIYLREVSRGLGRIQQGEVPDGSGTNIGSVTDHGALTGLADDDHAQYLLLAGRNGGQTLKATAASDDVFTIMSESSQTGDWFRLQNSAGTAIVRAFPSSGGAGTRASWRVGSSSEKNVTISADGALGYIRCDDLYISGPTTTATRVTVNSQQLQLLCKVSTDTTFDSAWFELNGQNLGSFTTDAYHGLLISKKSTTQTGDLIRLTDTAGTLLSRVKSDGTWEGPISTTGAVTVTDSTFRIQDNADTTKLLAFELGGFTTATTRTLTPPNADTTIAGLGVAQTFTAAQTISADLSVGGNIEITDNTKQFVAPSGGTTGYTFRPALGGTPIRALTKDSSDLLYLGATESASVFLNPAGITAVRATTSGGVGRISVGASTFPSYTLDVFGQLRIGDITDTTKRALFDCASITTATTRTYTLQNSDCTLAGVNIAQTFTAAQTITPATDVTPLSIVGTNVPTDDLFEIITNTAVKAMLVDAAGVINFANSFTVWSGSIGASNDVLFDAAGVTTTTVLTIPSITSTLAVLGGTQTFSGNKTFSGTTTISGLASVLRSSTATSGVRFGDNTDTTKALRMVLSACSTGADNSFTFVSTADRNYGFQNLSGNIPIVGDDAPAVASGALGKVDLTAQTANITSTNLSSTPPTGLYVVEAILMTTTADATAGTLALNVAWTDNVGATNVNIIAAHSLAATGRTAGSQLLRVNSGDIAYTVTVTGIYGTAAYAVYVRVTALG